MLVEKIRQILRGPPEKVALKEMSALLNKIGAKHLHEKSASDLVAEFFLLQDYNGFSEYDEWYNYADGPEGLLRFVKDIVELIDGNNGICWVNNSTSGVRIVFQYPRVAKTLIGETSLGHNGFESTNTFNALHETDDVLKWLSARDSYFTELDKSRDLVQSFIIAKGRIRGI